MTRRHLAATILRRQIFHGPTRSPLVIADVTAPARGETRMASFVTPGLKAEEHALDIGGNGQDAMAMLRGSDYPLVIVDRMLPDFEGVTIRRQMRSENIPTCVQMLTARDALGDKIEGLNAGADDYLTESFAFDELGRLRSWQWRLNRRAPADRTEVPPCRAQCRTGLSPSSGPV